MCRDLYAPDGCPLIWGLLCLNRRQRTCVGILVNERSGVPMLKGHFRSHQTLQATPGRGIGGDSLLRFTLRSGIHSERQLNVESTPCLRMKVTYSRKYVFEKILTARITTEVMLGIESWLAKIWRARKALLQHHALWSTPVPTEI